MNSRPLPCVIFSVDRSRWVLLEQCLLERREVKLDTMSIYGPVSFMIVVAKPIASTLFVHYFESYVVF